MAFTLQNFLRFAVAAALMPIVQASLYALARRIIKNRPKLVIKGKIDDKIPFLPSSAYLYVLSFVQWALSYGILAFVDMQVYGLILSAQIIGTLICFMIFLIIPTTITPPEVEGKGFTAFLVRTIRKLDTPLVNLFPSLHCMASLLCAIGFWLAPLPLWLQIVWSIWSVSVFFSTVTVKQHYFVDIIGGLAVGGISYALAGIMPVLTGGVVSFLNALWSKI